MAILVGGVTDIGLSVLIGTLFQLFMMDGKATDASAPPEVSWLQLLIGLSCSVLGGYVAASIAKENRALNGLLASTLCVALGVYYLAADLVPLSDGFQLLLILITPLCYLVGASLRLRRS